MLTGTQLRKTAQENGIWITSTQKLYQKMAKGECGGFTVPAFNIRALTYDIARALFRAAKKEKAGAFIFELARSEIKYTSQSPKEYVDNVVMAALKEKFRGPLFFQGDHFKVKIEKRFSAAERLKEIENLTLLIKQSIKAGFYNIDIDASALSMKENFTQTANFTSMIRRIKKPKGMIISIGGEVGRIGGKNTTLKEFKEFMVGYKKLISGSDVPIIKIAIQTGSSHGGIMLASGKMEKIKEDFSILKKISFEARKYGMAGAVQHGASTLPKSYFGKFPPTGACEIHLATHFQNIVYDSPHFPKKLKQKIYNFLEKKFAAEKNNFQTSQQFFYKYRKMALGPFKKEISRIPRKNIDKICAELEKEFIFFFKKLKVSNTKNLISKIYNKEKWAGKPRTTRF